MKTTVEFLSNLKSLDIKLWSKDNQLHCSAPEGVLTEVLRTELAERKAEILAFLQNANTIEPSNIRPILPVSRDRNLPLSFNQQRLWLVEQIESDSSAYNMPAAFRLKGFLEVATLEHSLNEIIKRHEILRTIFSNIDGQPSQVICSDVSLKLPVVNLQKLPEKQQEEEAQHLLIEEARLLFDLNRWPLLRCKLLRLDEKEHLLLLTAHHIVFDGWSFNIFCQELATLYEAFTTRKSLPLPELPIQYLDFAIWQREWLKDDVLEAQMLYWKQQLEGSTSLLQLPTDRLRSLVQTHRGACQSLLLSKNLTEALKTLSHKEGATLFMTLLAAFKTLLHRYTGQEDILVGSPIAGRNRKELEGLIGFFVNTLVLRTSVSSNVSFRELLSRVREVTLGAYAHQDIPLEKLLEELKLKRDLNHNPLFRVWFNMANVVDTSLELSGLTVETISSSETPAKFDLNLYVREQQQGIELKLVYNSDLFGSARIKEMLNQFEYLLQQIVSTPEKTIQSYSLLTPQSRLLLPDPSAVLPEPVHEPITNLFTSWANRTPKQIAISQGDRIWTYDELDKSTRAIARVLIAQGIKRGDVVAVSGSKSFGLIASILGVLLSGGVLLTLAQNFPRQRQQLMLEQAEAQHLLYVGQLPEEKEWIEDFIEISFIDPLTGKPRISDSLPLNLHILEPSNPNDAAYVFFTSGTTGTPKGILGSHKGLSHFLNWQRQKFSVSPQDRLAQLTGLSFDVVLRDIFLPLTSGATLCLPEVEDDLTPIYILPWLEREQISLLHTVPTLAQSWLTDMSPAVSLRKLRWVFFAGEPLTETLVCRWRKAFPKAGKIVNLYGPTETTLAKCFYEIPDNVLPGVQPIGFSIPESQALVLGENGQICGIGELGEIVLRTPFRSLGYINASQENQRRFVKNHFGNDEEDFLYYTGDRGRDRPDGSLEILGRIDHQIKINGVRIEPEEIEAVLVQHPAIQETIVIARGAQLKNKHLVAYVVLCQKLFAINELYHFLKERIPEYMIPSAFLTLDNLPLTSNGKVDRHSLSLLDDSAKELKTEYIAPQTPTEKIIAGIWSEILGVERVGIQDNFFELGGHSLLATQLISKLHSKFSTKFSLSLQDLFEAPTISSIAEKLKCFRAKQNLQGPPLFTVQRNRYLPASFAQEQELLVEQKKCEHSIFFKPYIRVHTFCFTGGLNLIALKHSINEVVQQHEILRTSFVMLEGKHIQVITPSLSIAIPVVDLREISESKQKSEALQLVTQEIRQGFDRSLTPLLRLKLLRLEEDRYIGIFAIDHLICDGWSMDILLRQLMISYDRFSKNLPSSLIKISIQYAEFAYCQRQWLQGKVLEKLVSYWKEQLRDSDPFPYLELPIAKSVSFSKKSTYTGTKESFNISYNLLKPIRNLCFKQQITLFMLLSTILNILLHYYTGKEDISFITVVSNRYNIETERMIGWFANHLVMRTKLCNNPSFLELLQRFRKVALEAYAHQGIPYDKLINELGSKYKVDEYFDMRSLPYFFFNLKPYSEIKKVHFNELSLSSINLGKKPTSGIPGIAIEAMEHKKNLQVNIIYDSLRFEPINIKQMAEFIKILLKNVVIEPEQQLSKLRELLIHSNTQADNN